VLSGSYILSPFKSPTLVTFSVLIWVCGCVSPRMICIYIGDRNLVICNKVPEIINLQRERFLAGGLGGHSSWSGACSEAGAHGKSEQ
jgi:hypothetical protein